MPSVSAVSAQAAASSSTSATAASSAAPSGASTPKRGIAGAGQGSQRRAGVDGKEAFVPENVYDAMKENKRFDTMRVSPKLLLSLYQVGFDVMY